MWPLPARWPPVPTPRSRHWPRSSGGSRPGPRAATRPGPSRPRPASRGAGCTAWRPRVADGNGPRIVVVGSANIDQLITADRLPETGETLFGDGFHQGFGGKGANQAVAAARLGARVSMVAAVGDDANGRATIENFRSAGIATDDVAVVAAPSGIASIWVERSGANRILVVAGANAEVDPAAAAR